MILNRINFLLYIYSIIIIQLLLFIDECDGQRPRKNRGQQRRIKRRNDDIIPNFTGLWIILALVFLPPILYFIYNVIIIYYFTFIISINSYNIYQISRDPATPQVAKDLYDIAKERTVGFLSKRKNKKKRDKET